MARVTFIPIDVESLPDLPEIKILADKLYTLIRENTTGPRIAIEAVLMALLMLMDDVEKPTPFASVLGHIRFIFEQAEKIAHGQMPAGMPRSGTSS